MNNSSEIQQGERNTTLRDLTGRFERLAAATAATYPEGQWRRKTGNQSNRVRISNPKDGYDAVEIPCDTSQFFDGNIVALRDPETNETVKARDRRDTQPVGLHPLGSPLGMAAGIFTKRCRLPLHLRAPSGRVPRRDLERDNSFGTSYLQLQPGAVWQQVATGVSLSHRRPGAEGRAVLT